MSGPKRSDVPSRRAGGRQETRRLPPANRRGYAGDSRSGDRGQTTLDFAIGVSLFLAIVLFTFVFVPGILEPFDLTGGQDTIHTERIADRLSSDLLGSPETPYVLDTYCTVEFFNSDSPGECQYTGGDLAAKLNVEPWRPINVSIVGNLDGDRTEILCWDKSKDEFSDCSSGTQLAAGNQIPSQSAATITSRRTVSMNHEHVRLRVVMW